MTEPLAFFVPGEPKPKGSMRSVAKGVMVEQVKGSKGWREIVSFHARIAKNNAKAPTLTGPVQVGLLFHLPRPKTVTRPWPTTIHTGDIDKHTRNILDALADADVYGNDSQVVELVVSKRYEESVRSPGCWVEVQALEEDA